MVCILADTNLGQTIQGGITEPTEPHADGGTGRIVKPCQEVGECSQHAHHIRGHELLDGINMLYERFDDGDELGQKKKESLVLVG